jgi:hypothetical protein
MKQVVVGGGLETVTLTVAALVLPLVSVAVALRTWGPLALVVVSQLVEKSDPFAVTWPGRTVLFKENTTGLDARSATLSVALALTVTVPDTVPATGVTILTTGGVVSGGGG